MPSAMFGRLLHAGRPATNLSTPGSRLAGFTGLRLLERLLCSLVVVALTATSLPAVAAAPARAKAEAAAPATDGKTIALFRFTGEVEELLLRDPLRQQLEAAGYTVRPVALELEAAAAKVKCQDAPVADTCLAALGAWLRSNPKTAADYIVVGVDVEGRAELIVYDITAGNRVETLRFEPRMADIILPVVVPRAVVRSLDERREPPAPATPEEEQALATLDEPEKTAEELAAEQREIEAAETAAAEASARAADGVSEEIEVDLRKDFKAFCRTGKRTKRESRTEPKDLRPKCQLGPVFGYWQPRAWVALVLAGGTGLAMVGFYGAALAAKVDYDDAVSAVEAYVDEAGGDPTKDPAFIRNGRLRYDTLATEVSRTGAIVRERAIIGDALLVTTALIATVLTVIVFQDRRDARRFLVNEKQQAGIYNLRAAPLLMRGTGGLSLGFDF